MKILVCGSRDWDDPTIICTILDGFMASRENLTLNTEGEFTIIQGGARGADAMAKEWALANGVQMVEFPAEWDKYGRGAGPKRNQQMLDEKPDLVLAFSHDITTSRGTADMTRRAAKSNTLVYLVGRVD
jgi:hypothetical protein